ncbi:MAG TPA: helix-turn-helix transcriptional regulator [Actinoplanes sp.]|jgi:transcriptional regulator with XRE-family HTH domain
MSTDDLPAALRRLRQARGLSLAKVGELVRYSRKTIWDYEVGRRVPAPDVVQALDDALRADGELVARHARSLAAHDPGRSDRVTSALISHHRPDATMQDHLADILASQRALEDTAGARFVLPATLQQFGAVETLRRGARGEVRRGLLSLEAQYAQFLGWCHQDLGEDADSERWYARALLAAHEADDPNMVASVLSMRSNAAWDAGDPQQAAALGEAATRPDATPGVLALSHQQAARAYARLGDRGQAERSLDAAARLAQSAGRDADREPPWIYFFNEDRFAIQRALVLRELGDYRRAADLFRKAVNRLPPAFLRDRAVYLARLANALALDGQLDEAAAVAAEGRRLAERTGTSRALTELDAADRRTAGRSASRL